MKLSYKEIENGIRVIQLNGVLDLNGTYAIEVEFVQHCMGESARIIVDMSKVSYISSVGIPMLVNTARSVVNRGGKLIILQPSDSVIKVLEMVGVPQIVPIHNDIESAVASLQ